MNRWQFSGVLILILTTLVLVPEHTRGQIDCSRADKLFEEGRYEEARTVYLVLQEENPDLPCAEEGVKKTEAALRVQAETLYHLGSAYERIGQLELARDTYINALKKTPTFVDAQEGLVRVSQNEFAAVRTLADLGLFTASAELLEETVKENPGIPVPEDLKYLLGGRISWLQQVRSCIEPRLWSLSKMAKTASEAIVLISVIALTMFVFHWRILPWTRDYVTRKTFLDIERFENGVIKKDVGKGLAEAVEEEFNKVMVQEGPLCVHLVNSPPELRVPANIKSFSSPIKIISEMAEWAFPQRVITLHGCLQESQDDGAGLTLKLVNNPTGAILDSCMMWQKEYQPGFTPDENGNNGNPTPYYHLIKPAAHWVYFQFSKYSKPSQRKERQLISKLGTKNWKSFVYFGTGMRLVVEGNKKDAEKMYVRALNQDRNNRFALLARGILTTEIVAEKENTAEKSNPEAYEEILRLLKRAKNASEEHEKDLDWLQWVKKNAESGKKEAIHGDTIWYNATYQVAATYAYLGNWCKAEEYSRMLLDAIQETLGTLQECKNTMLNRLSRLVIQRVKGYLKSVEQTKNRMEEIKPVVTIQRAIHLVGLGRLDDATTLVEEVEKDESNLSYRSKYNLACYYSIRGEKEKKEEEIGKAYKNALEYLKKALVQEGSIICWAKDDPDLKGLRTNKQTEKEFAELTDTQEFKHA